MKMLNANNNNENQMPRKLEYDLLSIISVVGKWGVDNLKFWFCGVAKRERNVNSVGIHIYLHSVGRNRHKIL